MPRRYPPHHHTTTSSLNDTRQGESMLSLIVRNLDPTIQTEQRQKSFDQTVFFQSIAVQFRELVQLRATVSCSRLTGVAPSAVFCCSCRTHWMCFVFGDALPHTLVVRSGYLSYRYLLVSLKQSDSPLIFYIIAAFSPRELLFAAYFLFFKLFSLNPGDECAG